MARDARIPAFRTGLISTLATLAIGESVVKDATRHEGFRPLPAHSRLSRAVRRSGEIARRPLNSRLVEMIHEIESGMRGQTPVNLDALSAEVFA